MNITYKTPAINEVNNLCKLNGYLFDLSIDNFDETLNQDWKDSDSYIKFFSQYFKEGNYILCAYDNETMIGYISGSVYDSPEFRISMKIAELENLMVLPKYQKHKIGLELVNHFTNWAKENNAKRLKLSVYAKNIKALDFYKKLGFEEYDINLEKKL